MESVLPIPSSIFERAVLFDTSALVAIADQRDKYHQEAYKCFADIVGRRYPLYVTTLTIAETHRQILHRPALGYPKALDFLTSIFDGDTNILVFNQEDQRKAIELIKKFDDQELTFTDAMSMSVMIRMGLKKAFTFDRHFELPRIFEIIPPLI